MYLKTIIFALAISSTLSACSTIASSTNVLTDERIRSETSGALGYAPNDVTIVSKRVEGVNTYAVLSVKKVGEFTCIINGGNLFTMGMVNPPSCAKKGEPIKNSNPLLR